MNDVVSKFKSNKSQFREKIIIHYDNFFQGKDISEDRSDFWDEFFLLKANIKSLLAYFDKFSLAEIACLKPQINRLVCKCVTLINDVSLVSTAISTSSSSCITDAAKSNNVTADANKSTMTSSTSSATPFRAANALQTLFCFVQGVFRMHDRASALDPPLSSSSNTAGGGGGGSGANTPTSTSLNGGASPSSSGAGGGKRVSVCQDELLRILFGNEPDCVITKLIAALYRCIHDSHSSLLLKQLSLALLSTLISANKDLNENLFARHLLTAEMFQTVIALIYPQPPPPIPAGASPSSSSVAAVVATHTHGKSHSPPPSSSVTDIADIADGRCNVEETPGNSSIPNFSTSASPTSLNSPEPPTNGSNQISGTQLLMTCPSSFRSTSNLLSLLLQHRKYEKEDNLLRLWMRDLTDDLILNKISMFISTAFTEYILLYRKRCEKDQRGIFSNISSFFGSMIAGEEEVSQNLRFQHQTNILSVFFELVYTNDQFINSLLFAIPVSASTESPPPTHTHTTGNGERDQTVPAALSSAASAVGVSGDGETQNQYQQANREERGNESVTSSPESDLTLEHEHEKDGINACLEQIVEEPRNTIAIFLEYCSIMMQSIKENPQCCQLCFLIIRCLVENSSSVMMLHDVNANYKVRLYKTPMRHRKSANEQPAPLSRPLVFAILNLVLEFMQSHLMKAFPFSLYEVCLDVLHRLLCFQKRAKLRIDYDWKALWTILVNLMRFLVGINDKSTLQVARISNLLIKSVKILNFFVAFGDAFLLNPDVYDDLYYEIIRMASAFSNIQNFAKKKQYLKADESEKMDNLANQFSNIKAIINHFTPKIEDWSVKRNISALTQDEVLSVIRNNYDSLILVLHQNVDKFEAYNDFASGERSFFLNLTKMMIVQTREETLKINLEVQNNLQDLLAFR